MKQTESSLVKVCLDLLAYEKVFAYRMNSGAFKNEKGGFYRMGITGAPDIVAVISGQYIGIECKVGKNKLSESQFSFGERLVKAGGRYLVIRNLEDLIQELKTLK